MHKIYPNGTEFLRDNAQLIERHPIETAFFQLDAFFRENDTENYALKFWQGEDFLVAMRVASCPLLLFGSSALCKEAAQAFCANGLNFQTVLGRLQTAESFLAEYEKLCSGTHKIRLSMDVMFCKQTLPCDISGVRWATFADAEQIARFAVDFEAEALGKSVDFQEFLQRVQSQIGTYALLEADGKIVSVAQRTREMSNICAIAYVYTLPHYRGRGYSRRVTTFISQSILQSGKIPYLFVDKNNPVSNRLYQKIGYRYMPDSQYEIYYLPPKR